MNSRDSLLQSEAFSLDEIYGSDVNDEQNRLIIEFMKNMEKERSLLPSTVVAKNIKTNENKNNNKPHSIYNIIDMYKETGELKETHFIKGYNIKWKNAVVQCLNNLRNYIHKKYNRRIINSSKYLTTNCPILECLQKNENLISIFLSKPLCIHLYIYGINYLQIIYYIDLITQYINLENHGNLCLFLWLTYLLILLDSLQALDMDVASNLQVIKRFCLNKIENTGAAITYENNKCNLLNFFTNFTCKSNEENYMDSYNSTCGIFFIIYLLITEILSQK
ncbi:conserved Plasmodium protein, unknown function [Plasmodium berghei]|uniref:Uncharacterized protein n=2 Tax=Plasmodium berghei TaxID=5821 RepID=A0A509ALP1_PLABA|nr:conserved Plasmodium protein, unknown function [Plasmodium berghei ANKA]CXI42372.1 conserved Plasmodium protein, unknown function [Plasmodium berghei]SCM22102.1 conserved Plasmodium protein, unknown function [Plasmodium berghei]SCN25280.1 conserved Plasmodium protein, unknown function [Plasmodium berghei]SCO60258.1 conserved Plasmodium protein, unknown function [Plasmodium berghei]SCO61920.1 conserved Plasmodium protein, unknown function [Plasmodium berghei]|eukprot:XP_034421535.1 conserved Plasmodium protein, unknown function [Plasmodium berghei ANKA]